MVTTIGVATPSPTDRAEAAGNYVVASWTDQAGRHIPLRTGTYNGRTGFGWTKITQRHHINNLRVLRFAIKSHPGVIDRQRVTQRVYYAYALRNVCSWGSCRVTDSVRYQVVVDFKGYHSYYGVRLNNAVLGVQTAYCHMPNGGLRCPHWVDQAINAAPIETTSTTDASQASTDNGTTDAGFSNSLTFPLPSITNADGSVSSQHLSLTSTQPAGFVEPIDPIDTFDGNDPWYNGDQDPIVCGQCPPPDDGT